MNIIFFVVGLDSGGIENYLLRFLKAYHQYFRTIYLWCKGAKGGVLERQFSELPNVRIIKYSFGDFTLWRYRYLHHFIKDHQISAVCDFTGSFAGFVLATAKCAGVKKRLTFYRNSRDKFKPNWLRTGYRKFVQRFVKKYATQILSNSKEALDHFYPHRSIADDRFKVIYNGVNTKTFMNVQVDVPSLRKQLGLPADAFVIGHVGRFDSQKNHETIIKVMDLLLKKDLNIYALFCGKGTTEGIRDLVNKINPSLKERLCTFENRRDIHQILKVMDVFFFPSTIEGNPNALIEAMVSGLPVVASNIEPIKETVPSELLPFLKDPKDIKGFSSLIERLYTSKESKPQFHVAEWAAKAYDGRNQFMKFLNELSK